MLKALCFVSLAALTFGAAGCKDITKDAEALADRACACTDKVCSDKVLDDLVELLKNNKHAGGDEAKLQAAGTKIGTCVVKAGTDPNDLQSKLKAFGD